MLNIVLVEPEIPQNTGNIARTAAAIGARLHIVKPTLFEISDRTVRRAGLDYWQHLDLEMHESLTAFLEKYGSEPLFFVETGDGPVYSDIHFPENPFLLFGKETKGLPESLLGSGKGTLITIPILPHIRSLNLSNAVAVVAYEVVRQQGLGSRARD